MKLKRKAAPDRNGNPYQNWLRHNKDRKIRENGKHIKTTDTQRLSYAQSVKIRQTEQWLLRLYFETYPERFVCRADLVEAFEPLNKPINHITRMVYDAIKAGWLEVKCKRINPRSQRLVEYLGVREEVSHGC